ncbi:methyltransferase family protein [Amycolatopsis echigonensis]|jgi:SAM-dependent methyltransferase|uniref:Methyltransferase family protein n=1 Tax=Amycolatopsis echigonensis TaxID=2576905 RepID=A0A2N3WPY7_9PSEU|nr:class I SAM-dependent methyltransferase [Amycolatopsis niigatensis]PKV95951.1 methyltransferase family protein [Amycolatopsis niigatensis]
MSEELTTAAELFDAIGAGYEEAFGRRPVVDAAVRELIEVLPPSARVLDIGSGTGRPAAAELVAAGHRVTGIDVSAEMVRIAREQVPGAEFVQADVREWETSPGSWDAVCAFFSFVQLSRAETERVLGRIAGWLAPGGRFALVTVPADIENVPIEFLGHSIRVTSFPVDALVERVRAAGLEVTGTREETFEPETPGTEPEEHVLISARKPG